MTEAASGHLIELRVNNVAQLFHTLDPFPFRERDLDKEAEEFIVGWARELSADRAIRIVIHYPESEAQTNAAQELSEAFHRYFSERAGTTEREIKELFRVGRRSLGIGITILIICLVSAHLAGGYLIDSAVQALWLRRAFSFLVGSRIGGLLKYSCMIGCRWLGSVTCTTASQPQRSS